MENSVVTEPGRRVAAIFHDFTFLKLKGNGLTSIFVFSPFRQFESVCTQEMLYDLGNRGFLYMIIVRRKAFKDKKVSSSFA